MTGSQMAWKHSAFLSYFYTEIFMEQHKMKLCSSSYILGLKEFLEEQISSYLGPRGIIKTQKYDWKHQIFRVQTDILQQCCINPVLQKPTALTKEMRHTKHMSADFRGYCNLIFCAYFVQHLQGTNIKALAEVKSLGLRQRSSLTALAFPMGSVSIFPSCQ